MRLTRSCHSRPNSRFSSAVASPESTAGISSRIAGAGGAMAGRKLASTAPAGAPALEAPPAVEVLQRLECHEIDPGDGGAGVARELHGIEIGVLDRAALGRAQKLRERSGGE